MKNETTSASGCAFTGVERRMAIEAALAHYPALPAEQLQDVLHWFHREATAVEVGMVASNADIAERYRQFRADHLDRLSWRDGVKAAVIVASTCTLGAAILYMAL